jgi:hypothetical protein
VLLVLRELACVDDKQHANASSGNDASRHVSGNTASNTTTCSPLEPYGLSSRFLWAALLKALGKARIGAVSRFSPGGTVRPSWPFRKR